MLIRLVGRTTTRTAAGAVHQSSPLRPFTARIRRLLGRSNAGPGAGLAVVASAALSLPSPSLDPGRTRVHRREIVHLHGLPFERFVAVCREPEVRTSYTSAACRVPLLRSTGPGPPAVRGPSGHHPSASSRPRTDPRKYHIQRYYIYLVINFEWSDVFRSRGTSVDRSRRPSVDVYS